MQSFRSFGLLLEEQWPALGPKNDPGWPFFAPWITPPMITAPKGLKLCMRGFLDVLRRLAPFVWPFDASRSAMAGFRPFRNDNLEFTQDGGERS